jgi:hypothetical protein
LAFISASWSHCGNESCIRLRGVTPGEAVEVRPGTGDVVVRRPPMAGHLTVDADDVCFVPRFAFMDGVSYVVSIDGITVAVLLRPEHHVRPTTEVVSVHPQAPTVPRNLLRFFVVFSGPMSEGYARDHLRLVDAHDTPLEGALLATEYELWDGARRRLTVLLDPARIKRGLAGQRQAGYALRIGQPFRLVIDADFRDVRGAPLRSGAVRPYDVVDDLRRPVDPSDWVVRNPLRQTSEPLVVGFDRPLDYALLAHCLHVVGPDGRRVVGAGGAGPDERSWCLAPAEPWQAGPYELVIDDILEDLAGNSLTRVFDRDQSLPTDAVAEKRPSVIPFFPG